MRHSKNKDLKRRIFYFKKETRFILLNVIKKNFYLPTIWRVKASFNLRSYSGNATKIHNFCVYTYRGRGIVKDFKVSRHLFKYLASRGDLYGVKKSSW